MIDMHCHILPQLDDGPAAWDDSLVMARQLAAVGFTGVVATPHRMEGFASFDPGQLQQKVDELNLACRRELIPLIVYPGAEAMAAPELMTGPQAFLPALGGSRYLLLEVPLSQPLPTYLEELLFNLNARGFRLLLAHPERCYAFLQDPQKLFMLRKYKIFYQVNLASFGGHFGPHSRRLAFQMLRANMISFLGTDAHKADDARIFLVSSVLGKIKKTIGTAATERLLLQNPGTLLHNGLVDYPAASLSRFNRSRFPIFKPSFLKNLFIRKEVK